METSEMFAIFYITKLLHLQLLHEDTLLFCSVKENWCISLLFFAQKQFFTFLMFILGQSFLHNVQYVPISLVNQIMKHSTALCNSAKYVQINKQRMFLLNKHRICKQYQKYFPVLVALWVFALTCSCQESGLSQGICFGILLCYADSWFISCFC